MDGPPRDPDRSLPTLSVVVPNYNHGRYIEGALRGHLSQTAPPTEILVVDDGSTDDSCAVVERLAAEAPTLRLIRLGRNTGVNAAISHAMKVATNTIYHDSEHPSRAILPIIPAGRTARDAERSERDQRRR